MIEHQGVIASKSGNRLSVKILQQSACSTCHAKGSCMAADSKEKFIDVTDFSGKYKINDHVTIEGKESMGYRAVLWAFIIPVIILVTILAISVSLWDLGELEAAGVSLAALLPYYLILYLFRNKMADSFRFTIKNNN